MSLFDTIACIIIYGVVGAFGLFIFIFFICPMFVAIGEVLDAPSPKSPSKTDEMVGNLDQIHHNAREQLRRMK